MTRPHENDNNGASIRIIRKPIFWPIVYVNGVKINNQ